MQEREGRSRAVLWTCVVIGAFLLASCAPPPAPARAPVVSGFTVRSSRAAAPTLATYSWKVVGDYDKLTCRLDVDSDGVVDREIRRCSSISTALTQFDSAGTRAATLEVSDPRFDPVVATTSLSVADGPSEPYDITLRLDPSTPAEFRAAFETAEQRWEQVLTAGVRDMPLNLPAGLFGWVPAFNGTVDDLLIDAKVSNIDGPGGVLGRAGGLLVRLPQWQPYYGIMEFDGADLAALAASGRLGDVILHEMGHVLGLGTNWLFTGVVTDLLTNPGYTGRAAVAAHQELGGPRYVPLENQGEFGTIIGHWRESTFGDELMTGFLGTRPTRMSRMTIAALADLGYGVDLDQADPYVLPRFETSLRDEHEEHEAHDEHDGHLHTETLPPFLGGLPEELPGPL